MHDRSSLHLLLPDVQLFRPPRELPMLLPHLPLASSPPTLRLDIALDERRLICDPRLLCCEPRSMAGVAAALPRVSLEVGLAAELLRDVIRWLARRKAELEARRADSSIVDGVRNIPLVSGATATPPRFSPGGCAAPRFSQARCSRLWWPVR